jgi:heparosan-N-sulfate-glucuronate 5-epimerase
MRPLASARRVAGVMFSWGPGYEPQPPGLLFESDRVRGYFLDYRSKTATKAARTPKSLLPVTVAQLALGWHERMLLGEERAASEFERICEVLVAQAEVVEDLLLWPYELDIPKYGTKGRWYAGMAQGQAASTLTRAYLHTGRTEYQILAQKAIEPILRLDSRFVTVTPEGPILEEAEATPPSHILNGWIFALWGLWDLRITAGDQRIDDILNATVDCLRAKLHEYDIGWWTRYSLFPHRLPDLAKPFYHRLHVDQMAVLYRLTGIAEFGAAARRWAAYDSPVARCSALAQKVPFKIVNAVVSRAVKT